MMESGQNPWRRKCFTLILGQEMNEMNRISPRLLIMVAISIFLCTKYYFSKNKFFKLFYFISDNRLGLKYGLCSNIVIRPIRCGAASYSDLGIFSSAHISGNTTSDKELMSTEWRCGENNPPLLETSGPRALIRLHRITSHGTEPVRFSLVYSVLTTGENFSMILSW